MNSTDSTPPTYEDINRLADHIRAKTSCRPQVAIICGSGLGGLAKVVANPDIFPYSELAGFPISTVPGHTGQLVFGQISGRDVVLMQGRCHMYEGYPAWKVAVPIRTFFLLGVKIMIVTNAAGGLNASFDVGDVMVLRDHIGLPCISGINPLVGSNDERFGPRFPAMSSAYDKKLRDLMLQVAADLGLDYMREGIYCMLSGPMYESIAECRLLQMVGGDATGMSTVPEVLAARHCGIRVLGMSIITNKVVMEYDSDTAANHEEVLLAGQQRAGDLMRLITEFIGKLDL